MAKGFDWVHIGGTHGWIDAEDHSNQYRDGESQDRCEWHLYGVVDILVSSLEDLIDDLADLDDSILSFHLSAPDRASACNAFCFHSS